VDGSRGLGRRLTGPHHDITDTFPRTVAALRCHVSQITDPDRLPDFLTSWLSRSAAQGGLPEGRLAEAFQVLQTG